MLRAACTAAADAMGEPSVSRAAPSSSPPWPTAPTAPHQPARPVGGGGDPLEAVPPRVNVLSEECGFLDHGSALTLMMDPVDGTGNAAAGLPLATFTATLVNDGEHQEALTYWFATMQSWHATRHGGAGLRSTGRRHLDGSFISMIRPKGAADAFLTLARRADRARVFGSSSLEAAWVTTGVLDAFVDAGTDTHRSVDLAAALVLAGGRWR
ncbi:MAG: hypothetical protein R2749_21315 [Acidimicrobiales bacterium]